MRRPYLFFVLLSLGILPARAQAPTAWINELHYDNAGADTLELVEVVLEAAPTLLLGDVAVSLYNGDDGTRYDAKTLAQFTPGATEGAYAFFHRTYTTLQNGPDGVALSYRDSLLQFLCYEGTFTATDGPAAGHTCSDIGLAESNTTTAKGTSLQLTGTGLRHAAFAWNGPLEASPGLRNAGQAFTTLVAFDTTTATVTERAGHLTVHLVLQNPSPTDATTVDVTLVSGDPADLGGFTLQPVTFAPGSTAPATVTIPLTDDGLVEPIETFSVALLNLAGGSGAQHGVRDTLVLTVYDDDLPNAWLNEVHYDNAGSDANEFVEVLVEDTARADLGALHITLYDGHTGTPYAARSLALPDASLHYGPTVAGYTVFAWAMPGIQNDLDGMALSYQDSLLQFLCYEGTFTATDGPAAGHTCTDVGLAESGLTTPSDHALHLTGTGAAYPDFAWTGPAAASSGQVNPGQILNTVVRLDTTAREAFENDGGITLTLLLQNPSSTNATTVEVALVSGDPADLGGFTLQPVTFAPGSNTPMTVTIPFTDDAAQEGLETFTFVLQNPAGGKEVLSGSPAQLVLTLQDDDVADVWISEVDANQPATDTAEFVELAGAAGTDLTGYFLAFYSGADGSRYHLHEIGPFTFADEFAGYGFYVVGAQGVPERDETLGDGGTNLIQNGDPDGVALFDPSYNLVFHYAYGGTFTAGAAPPFPAVTFTHRRSGSDGTLTSMGFPTTTGRPGEATIGYGTLVATPGAANESVAQSLPVELVSFDALRDGASVLLRWQTATEANNAGFEVQQQTGDGFVSLTFVEGAGTTLAPQHYTHRVAGLAPGRYVFRLRQVDFDGAASFSPNVEVEVSLAEDYLLGPVYPNPFNPQAALTLAVPRQQQVVVEVFNLLGQHVRTLFDDVLAANTPLTLTLDGSSLPSGVYLFRARGEMFATTRHATLLK